MRYVVIEGEKVVSYGRCQSQNLDSFAEPGQIAMLTTVIPDRHWWDAENDTLREKRPMSISLDKTAIWGDGADTLTFGGVPNDAEVDDAGKSVGANFTYLGEGQVSVTATQAGTMILRVRHNRYIDFFTEVPVEEPQTQGE